MTWDQVHIFFDVVSALGGAAFFVVGLLIKLQISALENHTNKELGRLEGHIISHDGVCDTERKDFGRRLNRVEDKI